MPQRRRFVIAGLSRLTVRVAALLVDRGAGVVVVPDDRDGELAERLPDPVQVLPAGDVELRLREAGLGDADCFLALSDDDLENLGVAVVADALAPGLPIVLRGYNAALIEDLPGLNIRRAYSVSALAAPAFVAAALGADVLETLRLGEAEIPVCRLQVQPGSPIAGRTPPDLKAAYGCAVIAHGGEDDPWYVPGPDDRLAEGDRLLVGGPLMNVLGMAKANVTSMAIPHVSRRAARAEERRRAAAEAPRRRIRVATLLPWFALILALLLVAVVLVFAVALDLGLVDAMYSAVLTALGSPNLGDERAWLKVVVVFGMLAGGALVGIFFSYLASVATVNRWERRTTRAALRLSGHAVVTGLGTIGYRIVRILTDLGVQSAVIDRDPDPRFADALDERHTLVLTGDARLKEHLDRARVRDAVALFACTDDDLANIETCLQARRENDGIRTVARLFDEALAERITGAFGITRALSASRVAAGAFVGAATDERAIRPFQVGSLTCIALRHDVERPIPQEEVDRWRADGARVLAVQRDDRVHPPSDLSGGLDPGDSLVLAGPEDVVRRSLGLAPTASGVG